VPLTKDYIMRIVEVLSLTLQKILSLKESHEFSKAFNELNKTALNIIGLDLFFLLPLPDTQVIELLSIEKDTAPAKIYAAGILLYEWANTKIAETNVLTQTTIFAKSLSLLIESYLEFEKEIIENHKQKIEEIFNLINTDLLPLHVLEKTFLYFKSVKKFAKAEDILFDLIEENKNYVKTGIVFYENLLLANDEELNAGNLPRNEVIESLEKIRAMVL
jgi:hypothetical protein